MRKYIERDLKIYIVLHVYAEHCAHCAFSARNNRGGIFAFLSYAWENHLDVLSWYRRSMIRRIVVYDSTQHMYSIAILGVS